MLRYDRSRYIALGLPALLNALALPLYALQITTSGSSDEYAVPFYLVIALACGLFGVSAMIKRCRDIGSSAWGILLGFLFAPPLMLLVALVLIFAPSNPAADQLEAPALRPTFDIWFTGFLLLVSPWMPVLLVRAL
jgi:uncharacterized membrane protein YhaH (DUF805 family)